MSREISYQALINDYKGLQHLGKKLGLSGGMMQFGILVFANAWKHLEIPCYSLAAALLFSWCLYSFVKDFYTLLKIDKHSSQTVFNGIAVEKKNASFGNFFHEVLNEFNLLKTLVQRSLVNLVAFGCLGYFCSLLVAELNPGFVINFWLLTFVSGACAILTCKLYYHALRPIVDMKSVKMKEVRK